LSEIICQNKQLKIISGDKKKKKKENEDTSSPSPTFEEKIK